MARQLCEDCPSLISKEKESIVSAFLYLYYHVLFHHMTENAASKIELKVGNPSCYITYYSQVYSQSFNSTDCIEESLANCYLYEHSDACHIDVDYLKNELLSQTDAYKEFIGFTGDKFVNGCEKLVSQIMSLQMNSKNGEAYKDTMEEFSGANRIPIWLHTKPLPAHNPT